MVEILNGLSLGFQTALSWEALFYCFVGVAVGTFVGVIPGLGSISTIAMLLPLTYYIEPSLALIMLAGIYYGAAYGGSTASILLNIPGTPNTAVACLDGYPMAKNGRAGVALFITTIASFFGAMVGLVALVAFAPVIVALASSFSAQEYFALMLMGLVAAALMSSTSPLRGVAMIVLGMIFGLVGLDGNSGIARFTFGQLTLYDGISLVALAMGLFGVPELIQNSGRPELRPKVSAKDIRLRSMLPTRDEMRRSWMPMVRGSGIGGVLGALPGTGGMLASFLSYAMEKRVHKTPEKFGTGMVEGVAGPETANNAAIQTAFIPTLSLGIPGDAVMAVMLGALIIHGIVPGPGLISSQPALFWGVCVSFLIGNIMLVILNIPLIGIWVRVLAIPYSVLFPSVVVFLCLGVYSINYSTVDIRWLVFFGFLGYVLTRFRFEPAPLILGFILGPMVEQYLRRSLLLSRGSYSTFVERPVSAAFILITALICGWALFAALRKMRTNRQARIQG